MVKEVRQKLTRLGIEAVLFDLDDTLIYTGEIFSEQMQEYVSMVAEKINVEEKDLMAALRVINDEGYKRIGVNPKRWEAVVENLAMQFDRGETEIRENINVLLKIYSREPRIREGVRGLLNVFQESGVKMALVTHANVEWTHFKLNRLGLWDYFDSVVIVDENGHKKSDDWKKGMDSLKVDAEKCLVVGDSLEGDIRPEDELGARTVWLPNPWVVTSQGKVPEKTVAINEIFDLLAALDRLR